MVIGKRNILIITYGPVPTPQYQKIEGGGMRCWGLAKGLSRLGHQITISVNESFPQELSKIEDIQLTNWTLNQDFVDYINSFDAVIVSYCMGDTSVFIAEHISSHTTLVLDCYVPIYIEVSARNSENKEEELRAYLADIEKFNKVLKRGDYFLCANKPQKHMYAGILGSLGVINPHSYHQERILEVPFGIDDEEISKYKKNTSPYTRLGIKEKDFVLLWFGGLYPWFDFKPLLEAVKLLSKNKNFKFVLVGGKNPYNNHPDFVKQYDYVLTQLKAMNLLGRCAHMIDWVDFNKRYYWYKNADVVISINQDGDENEYSWRTRVMDFVWGSLPMLTNGGDPLSDGLIEARAAIKIEKSPTQIAKTIQNLMDGKELEELNQNLLLVRERFHWHNVVKIISDSINGSPTPFLDELKYAKLKGISVSGNDKTTLGRLHNGKRKIRKLASYARRARQKGIIRSLRFGQEIVSAQLKQIIKKTKEPKAILLSHPIDDTGAPLVLIEIAKDFSKKYELGNVYVVAPGVKRHLQNVLISSGIQIRKMAMGIGGRLIQSNLSINKHDFVLMNTVALYPNYRSYVYWMLESGRLEKATWFIHEDKPEIRLTDKGELRRIKQLVSSNRLQIVVPSMQTAKEYNEYLGTNNVKSVCLRVEIPEDYKVRREESDFEKIRFLISGTPSDGRKGQLLFLSALQLFEDTYKKDKPQEYRDYELDLISIENDYISEQIKAIGAATLGNRIKIYPKLPRLEALKIMSKANVTVCCSLNETFALFVAEGMQMGHVIIRNYSSGWQEQMKNGKNGYLVNDLDVKDLAEKIALVLARSTSNKSLQTMGVQSQKIASKFENANYLNQLTEILK